MATTKSPTGLAAATKVIVDAVQTTFGAAVVVLFFFGLALVSLSSGLGTLDPELRAPLIEKLMFYMVVVLGVLLVLRLVRPSGLAGPPNPMSQNVQIKNSKVE